MRRLITVLASLAVVSLLVPSIGLAIDPPVENGIGVFCIFTSQDIAAANNFIPGPVAPFVFHRLYFVLYNPQIAGTSLGAMTFSWRFEPPLPAQGQPGAPVVTATLPPAVLNIGDTFNVILGGPLPVVDSHALCFTADVMFTASLAAPTYIFLGPPVPTAIPGFMEYNDLAAPAPILAARPNSVDGLYENPVFGFGMTVATESETWGGVKSLFR